MIPASLAMMNLSGAIVQEGSEHAAPGAGRAMNASRVRTGLISLPHTKEDEARSQASAHLSNLQRERSKACLRQGDLANARVYASLALQGGDSDEIDLLFAYIDTAKGDYGDVVSRLKEYGQFNPSAPLPSIILARSELALGRLDRVRAFWKDYSSEKELWNTEGERGLPALEAPDGLESRVMLVFGKSCEYPELALNALWEVGQKYPRCAAAAINVGSRLDKLGRGAEALPFYAIASIYGGESIKKNAFERMSKYAANERDGAIALARKNPATAYAR